MHVNLLFPNIDGGHHLNPLPLFDPALVATAAAQETAERNKPVVRKLYAPPYDIRKAAQRFLAPQIEVPAPLPCIEAELIRQRLRDQMQAKRDWLWLRNAR
jgi:hypothetical protein